jgi:hypothetical protein
MLCRVEDVLLSSLCRFSSASFAFFAKISSLRACIVSATHAHIGEEGVDSGQSHWVFWKGLLLSVEKFWSFGTSIMVNLNLSIDFEGSAW